MDRVEFAQLKLNVKTARDSYFQYFLRHFPPEALVKIFTETVLPLITPKEMEFILLCNKKTMKSLI